MSSALASELLTTGPLGKSLHHFFKPWQLTKQADCNICWFLRQEYYPHHSSLRVCQAIASYVIILGVVAWSSREHRLQCKQVLCLSGPVFSSVKWEGDDTNTASIGLWWGLKQLICGILYLLIGIISAGFPGGSDSKESACNAGDRDLITRLRRSPGGGNGNPFQYSCLKNTHGQRSLMGSGPQGRKRIRLNLLNYNSKKT